MMPRPNRVESMSANCSPNRATSKCASLHGKHRAYFTSADRQAWARI